VSVAPGEIFHAEGLAYRKGPARRRVETAVLLERPADRGVHGELEGLLLDDEVPAADHWRDEIRQVLEAVVQVGDLPEGVEPPRDLVLVAQ